MISANQELRWKLAGIQSERQKFGEYLKVLDEQEQIVKQQLLTGTGNNTAATAPAQRNKPGRKPGRKPGEATTTAQTASSIPKRTRVISAAQRKKLSDSMKQRWAARRPTAETVAPTQPSLAQEFNAPELPVSH